MGWVEDWSEGDSDECPGDVLSAEHHTTTPEPEMEEVEVWKDEYGKLSIGKENLSFSPPLYQQRYLKVKDIINSAGKEKVTKLVDLGCSDMKFFRHLMHIPELQEVVLVDKDQQVLEEYMNWVNPRASDWLFLRQTKLHVSVVCGDATIPHPILDNTHAVTLIEVVEHLTLCDVEGLVRCVFGHVRPFLVVITTPNSDFNKYIPSFNPGSFRHWDHKFEWTGAEFRKWCEGIVHQYSDYTFEISGCGLGPNNTHCTQLATFIRAGEPNNTTPPSHTTSQHIDNTNLISATTPQHTDNTHLNSTTTPPPHTDNTHLNTTTTPSQHTDNTHLNTTTTPSQHTDNTHLNSATPPPSHTTSQHIDNTHLISATPPPSHTTSQHIDNTHLISVTPPPSHTTSQHIDNTNLNSATTPQHTDNTHLNSTTTHRQHTDNTHLNTTTTPSPHTTTTYRLLVEYDYPYDRRTQEERDRDEVYARFFPLRTRLLENLWAAGGDASSVWSADLPPPLASLSSQQDPEEEEEEETTKFRIVYLPSEDLIGGGGDDEKNIAGDEKNNVASDLNCVDNFVANNDTNINNENGAGNDNNTYDKSTTENKYTFYIINQTYAILPMTSLLAWMNYSASHTLTSTAVRLTVAEECFETLDNEHEWKGKIMLYEDDEDEDEDDDGGGGGGWDDDDISDDSNRGNSVGEEEEWWGVDGDGGEMVVGNGDSGVGDETWSDNDGVGDGGSGSVELNLVNGERRDDYDDSEERCCTEEIRGEDGDGGGGGGGSDGDGGGGGGGDGGGGDGGDGGGRLGESRREKERSDIHREGRIHTTEKEEEEEEEEEKEESSRGKERSDIHREGRIHTTEKEEDEICSGNVNSGMKTMPTEKEEDQIYSGSVNSVMKTTPTEKEEDEICSGSVNSGTKTTSPVIQRVAEAWDDSDPTTPLDPNWM
ncbi:hypothetical protein Pcinc_025253 [Petrolisthes cinctipes]|uniref:Small RNA 2'-O-methyltransferase n=1 Tax=Petrolisthes cinctipes TaxID=88211 RepID=A0AAE1F9P5_PETCI|nr:hypothetical protein Pcinc_025253 [Petrolisthes cinctipes]